MTILFIVLSWIAVSIAVAAVLCGTFALSAAPRRRADFGFVAFATSPQAQAAPQPDEEGRGACQPS